MLRLDGLVMRRVNGGHLVVGLALGGSLAFGLALPSLTAGTVEPDVPACEFEDSPGPCFWDATVQGNGSGLSFTVSADQTLTYWG